MLSDVAFSRLARIHPSLPLWTIRLEKKTELLEKAGIRTVRDLGEALRSGQLLRIPGIGMRTISEAGDKLERLAVCVSPHDGSIDWQNYHESCGLVAVPSRDVRSGGELLEVFGEVIEAIIHYQDNPIDRSIFTERLMRQSGERLTLNEIGASLPVPITRERVR
jgi:hypothetical protein